MSEASPGWDGARVRQLRDALGDSQQAFAERLGTRQQTVSEWERGASRPRRMAQRLLSMLAEEHGRYATDAGSDGVPPARDHRDGTRP
ncbi:MAG: helix-turn-helix domain-containing protein [Dehalococcoidia bacterium]